MKKPSKLHCLEHSQYRSNSTTVVKIKIKIFMSRNVGTPILETINTLIHWVVPLKTTPDSRPKWAKFIPVFSPKRHKNLPNGAAHTYMAYMREYPPGKFS